MFAVLPELRACRCIYQSLLLNLFLLFKQMHILCMAVFVTFGFNLSESLLFLIRTHYLLDCKEMILDL